MQFRVRWPDGGTSAHYSPSLVMYDHLSVGASYPVPDFLQRVRTGLTQASDRVRARYGMACTAAMASLAEIEAAGSGHSRSASVTVLQMHPPLPAPGSTASQTAAVLGSSTSDASTTSQGGTP